MNQIVSQAAASLMPHGYCLLWFPDLLFLHVASDLLIAAAYFTIPVILFYFVRRRRNTPFFGVLVLFALFILSCGATHLLGTITIWYPVYHLEGYAKLVTGLISALTALALFPTLPRALAMRSPAELESANRALATEIRTRRVAEQHLAEARDRLEERVAERTASLQASNARLEAEILERQRAEAALAAAKEQAEFRAHHDPLTGLANRRELEQRLERLLQSLDQQPAEHVLCYLDLDRFKLVNDTAGHHAGDQLLQELSGQLNRQIRSRDTLARVGGDEFCLLLENCPLDQAKQLAQKLVMQVSAYELQWQQRRFSVGLSIGLTRVNADDDHERLIGRADAACYQAKQTGRGLIAIAEDTQGYHQRLDPDDLTQLRQLNQLQLLGQLIQPLDPEVASNHHILLEPYLSCASGERLDQQSLLETLGRYRLIPEFHHQLLQQGIVRAAQAQLPAGTWVAIPLVPRALRNPQLLSTLLQGLETTGLPATNLCLAIEEPADAGECELVEGFIQRLDGLECPLMLSHFGRELAALNWLRRLPVQYLALDPQLSDDLQDATTLQMISTVVEICRLRGIACIATGVHDSDSAERLQALDISYACGPLFGTQPT